MKKKNGFTFVELIVAVAIIGVILTLALANYRGGRRQNELTVAVRMLASSIEEIRTKAQAGETYQDIIPEDGYYLYIGVGSTGCYQGMADFGDEGEMELPQECLHQVFVREIFLLPDEANPKQRISQGDYYAADDLRLFFAEPGSFDYQADGELPGEPIRYAGAVLEHKGSGRSGYVYLDLASGIVYDGQFD